MHSRRREVEVERLARLIQEEPSNAFRVQLCAQKLLCIHDNHISCSTAVCEHSEDERILLQKAYEQGIHDERESVAGRAEALRRLTAAIERLQQLKPGSKTDGV